MNGFDVCSSCRRHVKSREARCPFCNATRVARADVRLRAPRVSRAHWLAFGATVAAMTTSGVVGCSGSEPGNGAGEPDRTGDAATHGDGSVADGSVADGGGADVSTPDGSHDGATQADARHPDAATSCTRSGRSACGSTSCDNQTQWCDTRQGTCYAIDSGAPFPSQCSACPTCACATPHLLPSCTCVELDGGGVGLACHTCYGAPPARLERNAQRRARRRRARALDRARASL